MEKFIWILWNILFGKLSALFQLRTEIFVACINNGELYDLQREVHYLIKYTRRKE